MGLLDHKMLFQLIVMKNYEKENNISEAIIDLNLLIIISFFWGTDILFSFIILYDFLLSPLKFFYFPIRFFRFNPLFKYRLFCSELYFHYVFFFWDKSYFCKIFIILVFINFKSSTMVIVTSSFRTTAVNIVRKIQNRIRIDARKLKFGINRILKVNFSERVRISRYRRIFSYFFKEKWKIDIFTQKSSKEREEEERWE